MNISEGVLMLKRRIKKAVKWVLCGAVVALGMFMMGCTDDYRIGFGGEIKALETDNGLVSEEYVYFDGDEPTIIDEFDLLDY